TISELESDLFPWTCTKLPFSMNLENSEKFLEKTTQSIVAEPSLSLKPTIILPLFGPFLTLNFLASSISPTNLHSPSLPSKNSSHVVSAFDPCFSTSVGLYVTETP